MVKTLSVKWQSLAMAALIGIVIFLQYLPSIPYGFIDWDDTAYLQDDAVIAKGFNKESLHYAFTKFDNPYFMPLVRLSYMFDVSLYGNDYAPGFRITDIIMHIFNCLLLYHIILVATKKLWPAVLVGLLFAIHPQHVEAVVWIAGRKELLAAFFGLGSLYFYQQYVTARREKGWFLAALLAYGCSLMCKPIWVALPVLLLIWDYYPLQRLNSAEWKTCFREKLPFLLLGLVYSLLFTYSLQVPEIPVSHFPDVNALTRWLLPIQALGLYLVKTVMPMGLAPYYAFPDEINILSGVALLAFFLVVLAILWRNRKTYPSLLAGALWFGVSLMPPLKITILPQGEAIFAADRYTYLAHIGFFMGIVMAADKLISSYPRVKFKLAALATLIAVVMLYLGHIAMVRWENPETLWLQAYKENTGLGKAYPLGVLASWYQRHDKPIDAINTYKKAHEIYREQYIYPMMVASLLSEPFHEYQESEKWLNKILDESPAPSPILFDLGQSFLNNRDFVRAETFLSRAAERNQQIQIVSGQIQKPISQKQILILLALAQVGNNETDKVYTTLQSAQLSIKEKRELCWRWHSGSPSERNAGNTNTFNRYCNE